MAAFRPTVPVGVRNKDHVEISLTEPTNSNKLRNRKVLVSGASIAGPALAFWLEGYGFDVTVVEKASKVRAGGQAVDFKGDTHRTVGAHGHPRRCPKSKDDQ